MGIGTDTGGGGIVLVAPPGGMERKNPSGTNIGKSPIFDYLSWTYLLSFQIEDVETSLTLFFFSSFFLFLL